MLWQPTSIIPAATLDGEAEGLTLAPIHEQDAAALWPLAQDSGDWRWLPAGPFARRALFEGYVRMLSVSPSEQIWVVRRRDQAGWRAAGWLGVHRSDDAEGSAELGNVWFPVGLSRTPAATRAIRMLLDHLFGTVGLQRVCWRADRNNVASHRCADRIGFAFEGVRHGDGLDKNREARSTFLYSLSAEDWPARRAAIEAWLDPANFDSEGRQIKPLLRRVDLSW